MEKNLFGSDILKRYTKTPKDESVLMQALEELVAKHSTIGFGSVIASSGERAMAERRWIGFRRADEKN